jgi:hypothetical protein
MNLQYRSFKGEFIPSRHRPSIAISTLHAAQREAYKQKNYIAQRSFEKCSEKMIRLTSLSLNVLERSRKCWNESLKLAKSAKTEEKLKEAMKLANRAVEMRVRGSSYG